MMIRATRGNKNRYAVQYVPVNSILPSPENNDLYGEIEDDEQMDALIDSIERRGLEEPLILTGDNYSGVDRGGHSVNRFFTRTRPRPRRAPRD